MDTIIYIVGPTGVGKTALAVHLAEEFSGELVNADSVQVYKGLDIISGKDHPKNINLHLLDVVSPFEPFSVSRFQTLGEEIIHQTISANKLPIVVGGTGLYVKSLIDGIPTKDVPFDSNLRLNLEKFSVDELQKTLSVKRLEKMNESDRKNKRRLIRAIEIEKSGIHAFTTTIPFPALRHIQIGLFTNREVLKERISQRVKERLESGALDEAKKLLMDYETLAPQVKDANGYKQLFQYLKDEISLDEAIERWKISEFRHAKNQMTWFQKDPRVRWFDINDGGFEAKIKSIIAQNIL